MPFLSQLLTFLVQTPWKLKVHPAILLQLIGSATAIQVAFKAALQVEVPKLQEHCPKEAGFVIKDLPVASFPVGAAQVYVALGVPTGTLSS
jgi:hypothetical protein